MMQVITVYNGTVLKNKNTGTKWTFVIEPNEMYWLRNGTHKYPVNSDEVTKRENSDQYEASIPDFFIDITKSNEIEKEVKDLLS